MASTLRKLSDEELRKLLALKNLRLPESPKVPEVRASDYVDEYGEDALEVYLILDPATPEDQVDLAKIQPIFDQIGELLRSAGEERFTYMSAATAEEYDRRYTYDADSSE